MNTKPMKNAQRCGCPKCTRKRRGYDKRIRGTVILDNTIPKGVKRHD